MQNLKSLIIISIFILSYGTTMAQMHYIPLPQTNKNSKKTNRPNAREQADSLLTLPFWDDFSFSTGTLSDSLWVTDTGAALNSGLAVNPPTIGVVSFDGLDQSGNPYSANTSSNGPIDSLVSQAIDLSELTVTDNIYLSFFYQFGGNGEIPDETDSITVKAKQSDGSWHIIWPNNISGAIIRDGDFNQAIVQIDAEEYFHANFQFSFHAYGRQSGNYDVWNLDYVYMNKNRTLTDTSYPDRAISYSDYGIFGEYTSVPLELFDSYTAVNNNFSIYSLDKPGDQEQPFSFDQKVEIYNYGDDTVKITREKNDIRTSRIAPRERITLTTDNSIIQSGDILSNYASAEVNVTTILKASDNVPATPQGGGSDYNPEIYAPIDFRSNDTLTINYKLDDYFAYDDGTAETGAGLNYNGDFLAYAFTIPEGQSYMLSSIDMYFPYVGTSPSGKGITLMVWDDDNGQPGIARSVTSSYATPSELNTFVRLQLSYGIEVSGKFYIGYEQTTAGEMAIGFDKNTDTHDKIFYKVDTDWLKASDDDLSLKGSLMMRPVLGEGDTITSINDPVVEEIEIYPNPSTGVFQIKGNFETLQLIDLKGSKLNYYLDRNNDICTLNISHLPNGLYILQMVKGQRVLTQKIIKSD